MEAVFFVLGIVVVVWISCVAGLYAMMKSDSVIVAGISTLVVWWISTLFLFHLLHMSPAVK